MLKDMSRQPCVIGGNATEHIHISEHRAISSFTQVVKMCSKRSVATEVGIFTTYRHDSLTIILQLYDVRSKIPYLICYCIDGNQQSNEIRYVFFFLIKI